MQVTAMNGAISTKPQNDPVGELIASASQVLEQGKLGKAVLFLRKAILLKGRHGVVGSETRQLLNRLIGKSP